MAKLLTGKNIKLSNSLLIILFIMVSLFFSVNRARAYFIDTDGQLIISWDPPPSGGSVSYYLWSYEINDVRDSVTGVSPSSILIDSSVVLSAFGDWAIFSVRAVSLFNDTSAITFSDTAIFGICRYIPGDVNGNGIVNGLDVLYLVNFFRGRQQPSFCNCVSHDFVYPAADVNGDCTVNLLDVIYLVNYFKWSGWLTYCPDCPPGYRLKPPAWESKTLRQ